MAITTQPVSVTVTLPTTNTDGSPVVPGELVSIDVGYGSVEGVYTVVATKLMSNVTVVNNVVTLLWADLGFPALPVGITYVSARVHSADQTSVWAQDQVVNIAPPPPVVPNAPGFSIA